MLVAPLLSGPLSSGHPRAGHGGQSSDLADPQEARRYLLLARCRGLSLQGRGLNWVRKSLDPRVLILWPLVFHLLVASFLLEGGQELQGQG